MQGCIFVDRGQRAKEFSVERKKPLFIDAHILKKQCRNFFERTDLRCKVKFIAQSLFGRGNKKSPLIISQKGQRQGIRRRRHIVIKETACGSIEAFRSALRKRGRGHMGYIFGNEPIESQCPHKRNIRWSVQTICGAAQSICVMFQSGPEIESLFKSNQHTFLCQATRRRLGIPQTGLLPRKPERIDEVGHLSLHIFPIK